MPLADRVHVARRFLRAVRIDADIGDVKALEGFICPESSAQVLLAMANHVSETAQGAFTWTGPYGSGKSSLIVGLAALLNGDSALRKQAAQVFGRRVATAVSKALPPGEQGWHILPIVGRRGDPIQVLGEAIRSRGLLSRRPRGGWTEDNLIRSILAIANAKQETCGGLVIFIDELGKFLEAAAQNGKDIYIFQQIAEAASRSEGRLLIIGVLHQAFEEYANRLSREAREEWSKIQGRFVDLAVNTAGEEQIDLISRAIESDRRPTAAGTRAAAIANIVRRNHPAAAEQLARMLEDCWPLHPVVACLLGPISRRRFGQNQRSIFGFLNSAEPHAFQDYLRRADGDTLYGPDRLWDYLRANLESSILASPDGHRWALAADALERCESLGGDAVHTSVLKTIAVVDLFKERSRLLAGHELIRTCFPDCSDHLLEQALDQLEHWSLTIYKKHLKAFAIFAGSDFDIEEAVTDAMSDAAGLEITQLKGLAGLQPIVAKRHYHETGALRWFEVNLAPTSSVIQQAAEYHPIDGAIGQLILVIPAAGETEEHASQVCREAARQSDRWDTVAGYSKRAWAIIDLARELIALENVRNGTLELAGDAVARREIRARLASLQGQIESELHRAFDTAVWFRKHHQPRRYGQTSLNSLASDLADRRFNKSPRLHNELLNRHKPSSSAIAAQNILLRAMALHEGKPRLDIKGFPAERGLFESLLQDTGLYAETKGSWRFCAPSGDDPCRLIPMWEAASDHIKSNDQRVVPVSEIFDLWRQPPFGVKDGLLPVLGIALILVHRKNVAIYREGLFRTRFDDVDVDYLAKDPNIIQLRWMDISDVSRRLLSDVADIVREFDQDSALLHLEPIEVARGLIGIFEDLPSWTKRTMRLSENAIRYRDLFKRARDPNQFLFDDLPSIVGANASPSSDDPLSHVIAGLRKGLEELLQAYPSTLHQLRDIMLTELRVPDLSSNSLAGLRDRAANIQQLAGDFRLEAFVGRVANLEDSLEAFEGIASLAANKPPRDWVDPDLDRAAMNVAEMAQNFLRAETLTRVKGRPEKRHAMAVVVGINGRPTPLLEEFQVGEADRDAIDDLTQRIQAAITKEDAVQREILLAALAEITAHHMNIGNEEQAQGEGDSGQ
ncbi:MAG: ATP-binding protein [Gammaproteobacteria bacterium]|nr:ATP-binding protein [Gammaproteobacteria bacterium]